MNHYQFNKQVTVGPNGTVISFVNTEDNDIVELGTVGDSTYVYVPTGIDIPNQSPEINWQSVNISTEQREELKRVSPLCQLIEKSMHDQIRYRYTLEDEQYFARIGVGVALGKYTFEPGEQTELEEFGNFVESVRQWGRDERAKVGL